MAFVLGGSASRLKLTSRSFQAVRKKEEKLAAKVRLTEPLGGI